MISVDEVRIGSTYEDGLGSQRTVIGMREIFPGHPEPDKRWWLRYVVTKEGRPGLYLGGYEGVVFDSPVPLFATKSTRRVVGV